MTPIEIIAIAAGSSVLAAIITALATILIKRMDNRTQVAVVGAGRDQAATELAVGVLQFELGASRQLTDEQAKDISHLKVSNWLVLQHLLDVHRHFAEGNPPPPPPMPEKLLEFLREG